MAFIDLTSRQDRREALSEEGSQNFLKGMLMLGEQQQQNEKEQKALAGQEEQQKLIQDREDRKLALQMQAENNIPFEETMKVLKTPDTKAIDKEAQTMADQFGGDKSQYAQQILADEKNSALKGLSNKYVGKKQQELINKNTMEAVNLVEKSGDIDSALSLYPNVPRKLLENTARVAQEKRNLETKKTNALIDKGNKPKELPTEAKLKLGYYDSAAKGLSGLESILTSGKAGPRYLDPNTPFVGNFISDNEYESQLRLIAEDVGRGQSGGAINKQEEDRFIAMAPRAADLSNPEIVKNKLKIMKEWLAGKSNSIRTGNIEGIQNNQTSQPAQTVPQPQAKTNLKDKLRNFK